MGAEVMTDYTEYFSYTKKDEPKKQTNLNESFSYSPSAKEGVIGFLLGTVGYMLLIPLILQIVYLSVSGVNASFMDENTAMLINVVIQLIGGFVSLGIMLFWLSKKFLPFLRKEITLESIGNAIVVVVIGLMVTTAWGVISGIIWPDTTTNANEASVESIITSFPLLAVVFTCILAPLIEELTFRFYLFKSIEKKSPILAIITTTFVFAAVHMISSLTYVMTANENYTYYEAASNTEVSFGTSSIDTGTTGAIATSYDVVQVQFGSGADEPGQIIVNLGASSTTLSLTTSDDTAAKVANKLASTSITNWVPRNYSDGDEHINYVYTGEAATLSCSIVDVDNIGIEKQMVTYLAYEFTHAPETSGDIDITVYGRVWTINVDATKITNTQELATAMADGVSVGYIVNDLKSLPSYLISSLLFTLAYYKTKKLSVSIFAHMFNNLFAVVVTLLLSSETISSIIGKPELLEVILTWLKTVFHIG